ncbi:MAG: hypothetical protein PHS44_03535 [Candidatus Dojkabacteria bacterium]|nr:hypothetical protein [Candidatus Dojkabacteria bacterium]
MNTKIFVSGMFCEACCKLIRMDIEKKFKHKIDYIKIVDEKKKIGEVGLKDVEEKDVGSIKRIINSVGLAYKVTES